ncbi:MAG: hypothetical protein QOH21_3314 [Acidobacteriota bacterium]|nr:hypothetical protein [Acidobacteriota bacterium]
MSRKPQTSKKSVAGKKSSSAKTQAGSKGTQSVESGGPLGRIFSAVRNVLGRGKGRATSTPLTEPGTSRGVDQSGGQTASRGVRRQSDIPMDILADTYTPSGTSSKAGFRSDGADHQQDQEFATGVADERWNDEDRYTNKSGDPRIGTRGRTYEPGESRDESRSR